MIVVGSRNFLTAELLPVTGDARQASGYCHTNVKENQRGVSEAVFVLRIYAQRQREGTVRILPA